MVKWFSGLLWFVVMILATWGCGGTSLAARYPNAMLRPVCVLPDALEPGIYEWVYTASGRLVSSANRYEFDQIASRSKFIFVFDVGASKDSPRILPAPDNALECQTGFSWLDPTPYTDTRVSSCGGENCQLPSESVMFVQGLKPCPIALSVLEPALPDPRFLGQTPDVRSPFLQPLAGVAYPPNCAQLVNEGLKTKARKEALVYGQKVSRVLGAAMAGWNRFAESDNERYRNEFLNDPEVIAKAQQYIADRLNEIQSPPEYEDPELAGIAQAAFEEGYGQGMAQIQVQFAAFYATCTTLVVMSGPLAASAETAAAKALRVALVRTRAMPIFLPSAAGGGGAFLKRLPQAPSTTPSTTTYIEPRTPTPAPAVRPGTPPPPAPPTPPAVSPGTNSGQLHHAISDKVFAAIQRNDKLKGAFKLRDPQFTARAANLDAHNGYQSWHQDLDREIVAYIESKSDLDPKKFAAWLYKRYKQADLAARFPGGLGANK